MPAQVIVVGSFNVDHVWTCETLPAPGQTLSGTYRTGPGGKGFNQAIAARRAGADTTFICALGDDAGAQLAYSLAENDGLDLRTQVGAAPTGSAGIYVDARGRNSIVFGPGANHALDAAFVQAQHADIVGTRVLLAQLEVDTSAIHAALQLARASGVTTLLNPAPANVRVEAELLALVDVLTPNETEFAALASALLAEQLDPDRIGEMQDHDLHARCRALLENGSVVITLGAAGCFVSHPERMPRGDLQPCYRVPAEQVQAVDTTGAGDAFNGALAATLAGKSALAFSAHVSYATRCAALSTEREGAAEAMPTRAEVQARFGDRSQR